VLRYSRTHYWHIKSKATKLVSNDIETGRIPKGKKKRKEKKREKKKKKKKKKRSIPVVQDMGQPPKRCWKRRTGGPKRSKKRTKRVEAAD
jgi:hypothetical protein